MHLSFFTTFCPPNILVCSPNIFNKSTPVTKTASVGLHYNLSAAHTRTRTSQSALELGHSHCPNWRLGQDLGLGGFALALKLPELLNTNLPTVREKLGQTSSFPNGSQIWFPIGQ